MRVTQTPTPTAAVGRNVRAEMVRREKTQADLADALDMTQSAVSKRLRGVVAFDIDELAKTAEFLDVPLTELLAGVTP